MGTNAIPSVNHAPSLTYQFDVPNRDRRMRELIIYISQKCAGDPAFGNTKLNKILFYADFISFHRYGAPITGQRYQRLEHGPAPQQMLPIRRSMCEAGELTVSKQDYHGYPQQRTVGLRPPDLSILTGRDVELVNEVIESLWGHTATEVSRISHGPWWEACDDGQLIPYEFAYLSPEPLTNDDVKRTRELAGELDWGIN